MTASDRFDQRLTGLLVDLAAPTYPEYFDGVLERATRGAQRPAWTFPERWLLVSVLTRRPPFVPVLPWRTVGLLLLLALLLAAIVAVGIGSRRLAAPFGLADNGLIVYAENGDLYTRDEVTGEARLLLGGPTNDVSPIYSRDGARFAFIRIIDTNAKNEVAELLVANADGSNLHSVAGPEKEIYWWEWSPSGREIAIASNAGGAGWISIVNVEGDPVRRRIEMDVTPHGVWWRPPDGRELIFQGRKLNEYAIYAIRPDGTGLRQITEGGPESESMWAYSLSPDGRYLGYTSDADDELHVRIANLETGEDRQFGTALPLPAPDPGVEPIHDGFPVFSPDGTRIVFGRYWDERDSRLFHQLWVASASGNGADAVPIGQALRSASGQNPFAVTFSPDGTSIVFARTELRKLFIANAAGGATAELPWDTAELPDWQRLAPRR